MYEIKYTNLAEADLNEAVGYIAGQSVSAAREYLSGFDRKIELLRSNPFMGFECESKGIRRDCRMTVYRRHLVIYRVDAHEKKILIVRIFHHAEDYVEKLEADGERNVG